MADNGAENPANAKEILTAFLGAGSFALTIEIKSEADCFPLGFVFKSILPNKAGKRGWDTKRAYISVCICTFCTK
jgi:hypothetical protein